jgi:hypothetical protein
VCVWGGGQGGKHALGKGCYNSMYRHVVLLMLDALAHTAATVLLHGRPTHRLPSFAATAVPHLGINITHVFVLKLTLKTAACLPQAAPGAPPWSPCSVPSV